MKLYTETRQQPTLHIMLYNITKPTIGRLTDILQKKIQKDEWLACHLFQLHKKPSTS